MHNPSKLWSNDHQKILINSLLHYITFQHYFRFPFFFLPEHHSEDRDRNVNCQNAHLVHQYYARYWILPLFTDLLKKLMLISCYLCSKFALYSTQDFLSVYIRVNPPHDNRGTFGHITKFTKTIPAWISH
jgi:hypothetical protein